MSRLAIGMLAAVAVALVAADASLFGVAAWKILLALAGLALLVYTRNT